MLFVAAMLGLAACDDRFPDYSYKMTVYADGKAFSSVRHVEVEEVPSIVDSSGTTVKRRVQGQAVVLDLDGRTYYALLARPGDPDYAKFVAGIALGPYIAKPPPKSDADGAVEEYRLAHSPQDSFGGVAENLQAMVKVKGARELPREFQGRGAATSTQAWPMFVTFDDPTDPKTVREVPPDSIGISRITIEITDEDVTSGIEKRLPWLPRYFNRQFSGERFQSLSGQRNNGLSAVLSSGVFSAGNGLSPHDQDS
jgi:hypothetical protein